MNILLVSGPGISLKEPYNSGIEAFIVSFANQLVDEGHTVDVVADEAEANSNFNLLNPFNGFFTAKHSFIKRIVESRQFKKLRKNSYDVIHYNMFYPHLIEAGLHFKKASFLTLHSPADRKRISVYKKLSRQSDLRFVAISERVKSQWGSALNIDMPLIQNGIEVGIWPTVKCREPQYLLWSARIAKEKNISAAIRVSQYMQLPLIIAGRIIDRQYFDKEVKPHINSQIQYVGHVTQRELNILAQKAYAYLATASWQEPFGLAALEMLASGLPVVGFNTAVPQDWDHESVLTTSSSHWQDLIELVKKSDTISPDACKDFASTMNIQKMTSNYIQLYKGAFSNKDVFEKGMPADDNLLRTVS